MEIRMTSKELLYMITVADEKSISKAARKLYMAQPSLSQSIQRIEESVGTPLFHRTSSGLTLTYAGERYYHMACEILKRYENFELEVSDISNLKTGRVPFGITNHLGTLTLGKVLPRYREICPNIELFIHEENTAALEQLLLSGSIDFAIMHAPKEIPDIQIHYDIMTRDPFVIAVAPEHELIKKAVVKEGYPYPVIDLKLLKNENFLMLHKTQRIRQITDTVLNRAGIHQPKISLTLKNYETALMLAAKGLGIMLIPLQYSQIAFPECRPQLLSIEHQYDASWDLCIATVKNGYLTKADQLFIRIFKENFSET
jgi:DNA-binding transcriptional LysR family regulator